MASEAIKKMFMQRMLENQQAKRAGAAFKDIAGSPAQPEQTVGDMMTDPQFMQATEQGPVQGLMDVGQEAQPATGLFDTQNPNRFQQFAIDAAGTSSPSLQKYGLEQLGGYGKQGKPTTFMQNFDAFRNATPDTQKQMLDYKRAGAQNINLGGNDPGKIWNKKQVKDAGLQDGTVVATDNRGMPKIIKSEKYTQPQILSGGFALRMNTANSDLESVMGSGFDPATVQQNSDFFAVPGTLSNFIRTPEGQRYRQAQENWITANLRKESGAAIPEPEVEREMKKWFPVPGDDAATITQKAKSRKDAERAMKKASGGVFDELQAEKTAETSDNVSPSGVSFTVK